jgi:hypothetical protein
VQAHHAGLGPVSMHTDDQDFVSPDFFSSGATQQHMGVGLDLNAPPSWGGAAAQPDPNWFGAGPDTLLSGGRSDMPHTLSAPSLGMLQQQKPSQSAQVMGGPPIMRTPGVGSHSQTHMAMSGAPWASPNRSTQSAPPMNNDDDLEERLKEIMNQSNAAMSSPVNFDAMSAQMSGQVSMDSTCGTRDPIDMGTESAAPHLSAHSYPGKSQPSPVPEVCYPVNCACFSLDTLLISSSSPANI